MPGVTSGTPRQQQRLSIRRPLVESRSEAYQRIAELELQVGQKVCALVDAEKELTVLRERFEKIATEKSDLQAEAELEAERQRREEAEALADNLRRVAATLRTQVDELQEKLLLEAESAEAKQNQLTQLTAENERLRTAVASRTELVEAEHQRSESELETLCDERRTNPDERLKSAENEKIRLEEQLLACEMKCDDLKIELQLQKANNSELTEMHNEANRRCEDAQATLQTVEAENMALIERLAKAKEELEDVKVQLRARITQDEVRFVFLRRHTGKDTDVKCRTRTWEKGNYRNNLLKDSEARLLDSVDEYGLQAEKYQQEAERLQQVVNRLEKERMELEGKSRRDAKRPRSS
ncbi:hypothetical protein COOONC_08290 [Cooperia oncophora]